MTKEDLSCGNVVETREGLKYLYINDKKSCYVDWLVNLDKKDFDIKNIYNYRDDLTYDHMALHHLDIMKVYEDYTLKKLLWERKEKPKLTEEERIILKNINEHFEYIARNEDNRLYLYEKKPRKIDYGWQMNDDRTYFVDFYMYDNLFQFIQWGDEEPYLIEDLLKEEDDE